MHSIADSKVAWTDIPNGARDTLFRVWTDARELLWAEKCWGYLDKRGLTAYSNEIAKVRVLARLMSLAEIYREFCDRAWEERYDCELAVWASEIGLNRFRVAQCVGSTFEELSRDDEDELYRAALMLLAEQARREIYEVLIEEFGGESYLFVSLWNTVEFRREDNDEQLARARYIEDDHDEPDQSEGQRIEQEPAPDQQTQQTEINWLEDAETILWDVTPDKMCAYQWIDEGMPRIR
jgi:hypothetical protein